MFKKRIIVVGILFFGVVSCNFQRNEFLSNDLFIVSLGIKRALNEKSNTESERKILNALDSSNDSLALRYLTNDFQIEMNEYNGYIGILPAEDEQSSISNYLSYRYNESVGDMKNERLYFNLLGNAHLYRFKKDYNDSVIRFLNEIEESYLSFYLDSINKYKYLEKIKSNLEIFPSSNRLKYLYANMNFEIHQYNICLPIYDELLRSDYYSYKILRRMAGHYKYQNSKKYKIYLNLLEKQFTNRCALEGLEAKKDSSFIISCNNCMNGNSRRDSIKATVVLTRYYLNNNNFNQVVEQYESFIKSNQDFILDSLKIWEAGEYYDIMLHAFFFKSEYAKFCTFLFNEVGYNRKIKVENSEEFYNLIKQYYFDYNKNKSLEDFDIFFKKNFFHFEKKNFSDFV